MTYAITNQTAPSQFGFSSGNFLPARLDAGLTAKVLGFKEHDIPILVVAKMLKPLGKPVPNAKKYFATCEIEGFAIDTKWLREATQIVYDYWVGKNERKTANAPRTLNATQEIALAE
jgi:hypothetical protein